uniref:Tail assembly chaperone n=1 Tax=Siphoviridae sp. ctDtx1 TaxID=2825391 RepID=A0A8S5PSX1_9CAUD|nr:MAG TPA: tail assembly chaperone [Siphoviridae sp. ctDtx1]
MKINGVELEDIDFYDLEVAEKYDKSMEELKKVEENNKNTSMTQVVKTQCETIFNVFNTMFGEGTDKKVFGNRVNLKICLKAFSELVDQANEQRVEIEKIAHKYSPNRAQRRAKK